MCMGFSGPHHLSCCFMLHTLHLNCPFTVFPRSSIHLFSPSCQMSRPSLPLSLFAAGCVIFHCKTHTAPQMCAHIQTNAHTCRSRGYRELSEMPNLIPHNTGRAARCQTSNLWISLELKGYTILNIRRINGDYRCHQTQRMN